ncbi:MAG: hypothetical protein AAF757_11705 [Cyanobacteria bacterium P01_D01_bin.116]
MAGYKSQFDNLLPVHFLFSIPFYTLQSVIYPLENDFLSQDLGILNPEALRMEALWLAFPDITS